MKLNLGRILGLTGLGVLLAVWAMAPTRAQQASLVGGRVYAPPGTWISYSPAQLGANGITLPASGSTPTTNTIDMRGVKDATLSSNCTQTTDLNVELFSEDGSTIFSTPTNISSLVSGPSQIYYHSGQPTTDEAGTVRINVELPQRAMNFFWSNTTATAGTCTARLFVQY
jgi:hypothetical protein